MAGTTGPPADDVPLLVYDGDCGFCTSSASWVARRWSDDHPKAVPWQELGSEGLEHLGLTREQVDASAWWIAPGGEPYGAEQAIGQALRACRRPWSWIGTVVLVPPGRWLGKWLYPLIARHRHRLPGGTPSCRLDHDR